MPIFRVQPVFEISTPECHLYDMLVNARVDSFDAIVDRNTKLSEDYDVLSVGEPSDWKHLYQKERANFVKEFYNYAKAHPRGEGKLWSEWVSR